MMKSIIPSFVLLFTLLACKKTEMVTPVRQVPVIIDTTVRNDTSTHPDTAVITDTSGRTYLALGDSYTIGQSVAVSERFPVQAVYLLNNANVNFRQPEIIAQTGWTTGNLIQRLENTPPLKSKYDIVTLLIGVNNQYQGRSQDEYRQHFTTLLQKAIQYADNKRNHVFVLSIPDYSVTPFASNSNRDLIARQIDSFNAINDNLSNQYGVHYIYITDDTRQAATNPSLIATDGLHPSGLEYAVWANKLAPMVRVLFP